MIDNIPPKWEYVLCTDGSYSIYTVRVPVTDTTNPKHRHARIIGTARDKDTAILMAAAPDMFKELNYILECLYDMKANSAKIINRIEDLLSGIAEKESDYP